MKKNALIYIALMVSILNCKAQDLSSYNQMLFDGISNEGKTLNKNYITAGNKSNIIGTQNGDFPDLGSHVEGEMGGVWTHPIKLLDGFWLRINDTEFNKSQWLEEAEEFINYPYGNKFRYSKIIDGLEVERMQFSPQDKKGVVVVYSIKNTSKEPRTITLDFAVKTDISPVWFSKENNIIDSKDTITWNANKSAFIGKDLNQSWFSVWGSSTDVTYNENFKELPVETQGKGVSGSITSGKILLEPKEIKTMPFFISGSTISEKEALETYEEIRMNWETLLSGKKEYYNEITNRGKIVIPDKNLQQAYNWGKFNTEWLVMDLDSIGKFLGAGAIEYPWLFGTDNSYALQGVLATGDHSLAKSTLRTIKNVSEKENGNGRIIHEMSSNGFVGNKGNTQETAHFVVAVWETFKWTGDMEFLKEMYPYIKKGLSWLLTTQDGNGNMFPEGYGIMEVKGLNAELIDVAVYTQQALELTSQMANILNDSESEKMYSKKADTLKEKINNLFWDKEEGSYTDFYGTREQALQTTNGAIEQLMTDNAIDEISQSQKVILEFYKNKIEEIEQLPEGTKQGWFTNKNWVINTPMETGIAPNDNALSLLDKIRNDHTGEHGPFLSAVARQRMMTIATGVQAMAEAKYGRTDEAMWYVNKIVNTFGEVLPGSISEMMPDYGCPVQAWTIYGLASPLITHVFGFSPNAFNKTVTLEPSLPSEWNNIQISDLPVGDNLISFKVNETKEETEYILNSKEEDWTFNLILKNLKDSEYSINGVAKKANSNELVLKGKEHHIVLRN